MFNLAKSACFLADAENSLGADIRLAARLAGFRTKYQDRLAVLVRSGRRAVIVRADGMEHGWRWQWVPADRLGLVGGVVTNAPTLAKAMAGATRYLRSGVAQHRMDPEGIGSCPECGDTDPGAEMFCACGRIQGGCDMGQGTPCRWSLRERVTAWWWR
jgi:hypothetical protein